MKGVILLKIQKFRNVTKYQNYGNYPFNYAHLSLAYSYDLMSIKPLICMSQCTGYALGVMEITSHNIGFSM